jgi:hypothetical protein
LTPALKRGRRIGICIRLHVDSERMGLL